MLGLLSKLHDPLAAMCANAERDVLFRLGGGCSMPLGVLVTSEGASVRMRAAYYTNPEHGLVDAHAVFADLRGDDAMQLATSLAGRLRLTPAVVGAAFPPSVPMQSLLPPLSSSMRTWLDGTLR